MFLFSLPVFHHALGCLQWQKVHLAKKKKKNQPKKTPKQLKKNKKPKTEQKNGSITL